MATNTTNYGWTKPSYEDDADIMVINGTIDAIDSQMKSIDNRTATNENNISSVQAQADWNSAMGVTNLFDFDKWKQGLTAMRGTVSISENSVTVQATSNDAYTKTDTLSISVMPNTKYILTWNTTATTEHNGTAYIFPNLSAFKYAISTNERLEFTTGRGDTSITIRFGVDTSGDSITYSNIMLRSGTITDNTYQPYALSNAELTTKEQQNENNISFLTANGGGKNYFNPQAVKFEPSSPNVTYSLSGDTITLSVTSSPDVSELNIKGINFPLNKDLILTGCPANTGYTIRIDAFNNSTYISGSSDTGMGSQPFQFTTMTNSRLRIRIGANTSFTNLQFKIMVRDSNTDFTYQPYAMSNAELTAAIQALQAQLANLANQ